MKILIIRAGALGDTLMLMPVISSLKMAAEVTVAGRRPGIDYLRPYVAKCVDMETSGWHMLFMEGAENLPDLSLPRFDHVAAFLNDPDGRLTARLRACFPRSSVNAFPVFPPEDDKAHIALYMAEALRSAGLPADPGRAFKGALRAPLMAAERTKPGSVHGIVIHPGSGSVRKNYPPAFWLELIGRLRASGFAGEERFTLLLGPAEEQHLEFFRESLAGGDAAIRFMPEREELLNILGSASVYIGHDSGITHLAAMMGVHTIAVFKDSPIERWRPLGPHVQVIGA